MLPPPKFYTYLYLRANGTPYYVGKGQGRRAFSTCRIIARPEADARILIQHWESESKAFEMEKWYIRLFGRKDNGTGILRNLTDGGEGFSGLVFDAEHCRKIGEASKGRSKGVKRSKETCQKISAAKKASPSAVEHCRKVAQANIGRVRSPEACVRIRDGSERARQQRRYQSPQLFLFEQSSTEPSP